MALTSQPHGYTGRLRHVDLTTGSISTEALPERDWRRYVGGGLLGVRHLLTTTPPGLDAFDPAAPLMFLSSVIGGHHAVGLSKFTIVAKSPLTGGVGEARVTGPFGMALKASACDGLVLCGRAAEPSYLLVDPDGAQLHPARDLWGFETQVATETLKQRHGDEAAVALIGPAGEQLVRYASILTEWIHPANRMGLGAVMGSKNLKAVVVVPGDLPPVYDPDELEAVTEGYRRRMTDNSLTASQLSPGGFGGWFLEAGLTGYAAVRNFDTSVLPTFPAQTPEELASRVTGSAGNCPGCPNECIKRYANAVDGRLGGLDEEGLAALALGCEITDLTAALDLHARCHALGLDPVSLAAVWAHVRERGRDDGAGLATVVEGIARRTDGCEQLGEGVRRMAESVGESDAAMHVKGLEFGRYDPRASAGQALAYAISPLGPRYEIVEHDLDFDPVDGPSGALTQMRTLGTDEWEPMERLDSARVARTATLLDLWSGLDALGLCLFAGPPMRELTQRHVAELIHAVTGWLTSDHELFLWGRRRWNLMRLYNLREGIDAAADRLPDRFFDDPIDAGRLAGAVLDRATFTKSVREYYALAGWDDLGRPLPITLASLGLLWADTTSPLAKAATDQH
ncbi:aldehyde ferredoxin oxidoreductase C-terminal domain-containing protein [Mycolicibacterium sp. 050158]|uniref:aldehyde ferredoxin oxidoreductase C-terminal domain-containing protein n=1 Tax=Mycolicibacterium sp. 050158 TaxID=3090602 RepID=UPI00299E7099|nr:aldehyde ferredoxin oxidoreductase C-terminal domain-containing protein [Mycolicibacterium sp. 050158]MDX1891371.1 aldehyde ferredoxin oxidoreductase C-terminal domain-containing protein [Mycolicibacterium sp. 050158]